MQIVPEVILENEANAKRAADFIEAMAQGNSRSAQLTLEQRGVAISLCGHALALLLLRNLHTGAVRFQTLWVCWCHVADLVSNTLQQAELKSRTKPRA